MKHIFLVIIFVLWSYSYYRHFVDIFKKDTMAVLLTSSSIRDFALRYSSDSVDLFALSESNRRSLRMGVLKTQDPFKTFRDNHYGHLLLVDTLTPLHMTRDTRMVIRYVQNNHTVASYWPRLEPWPSQPFKTSARALEWYQGPVVTSYL